MTLSEVKENPAIGTLTGTPRRLFKRQDRPRSFAELLEHTGFFVRVDTYCPLEPPMGTAVAELGIDLDVGYNADPVDNRGRLAGDKRLFSTLRKRAVLGKPSGTDPIVPRSKGTRYLRAIGLQGPL